MSYIKFTNFIFIIILFQEVTTKFTIVMNEECKSKINIDDSSKFLLEVLRGKIPLKIENKKLNEYDLNMIQKINKNIPCPYMLMDKTELNNRTIGIYVGAGINLQNYKSNDIAEINSIFTNKKVKYRHIFIKLLKDVAESTNLNESILKDYKIPLKNLDTFNREMIYFRLYKFINKTNNTQILNSLFLNSILSFYIQQIMTDDEFKNHLYKSPSDNSLIVEYMTPFFPYTRLIQSKLINLYEMNYHYNYNHIFFVIEKNIFLQNELDNINTFIKNINDKLINNNRISILIKNENNYTYIINYKKDKYNLDEFLKVENKLDITFDLSEIYNNINKKYEENKIDYFENKIVILFLNYETKISGDKTDLIEKYKNNFGIQTIPIINIANVEENSTDIFEYNIFNSFTEQINIQYILLAINNMHIPLSMTDSIQLKKYNISITNDDSPLYFEIKTDEIKNNSEYYEISLDIKKSISNRYNIFISSLNPYPNTINNLNNYMKYLNESNPKIRIKSIDIINNTFYLGIEGNISFNLTINKKFYHEGNISNLILSEGEYDYVNYDVSIENKNYGIYLGANTFGENFTVKSKIFYNETKENMMKYFTRGIDKDNTDDKNGFFNYKLFSYLYEDYLINRVYQDKNKNYFFGVNTALKTYTPFDLKKKSLNRFIINKVYPFLKDSADLDNEAPSVFFDDAEFWEIFDVNFIDYIIRLTDLVKKCSNCLDFDNQQTTMKFILFCLYFTNKDDTAIIKAIIYLSFKQPEYANALLILKGKKNIHVFLLNCIKQLEQAEKSEKIMTSIIMGKSLLLSDIGMNFISGYYNIMSKSMTKISVSIYDTKNNEIKNLIHFSSKNNNQNSEEEISKIYEKIDNNDNDFFNSTQIMDFKNIINFAFEQFKNIDKGIKKKLILICNENLKEDSLVINNNLKISDDYDKINLASNQVELILITSQNYEKGEIPELFIKSKEKDDFNYTIYENYFYVPDLNNTENYMSDLNRLIKGSTIKIKLGSRLINDYYQEKNTYFQIDCSEYPDDVIVIKTNISNYNFYASLNNPFPFDSDNNILEIKNDAAVIFKCQDGHTHLGLEPKYYIRKEVIEIFSCESYEPNKNCKSISNNRIQWILLLILVLVFLFFFVIYKCKYNLSTMFKKKNKKRLNVFDTVK